MRKKIFFTLTLSLFVCLAALLMFNCGGTSETSAGSTASIFAISGVNLWDGAGNAPIRDSVIVVSDSRIQAVGPRGPTAWIRLSLTTITLSRIGAFPAPSQRFTPEIAKIDAVEPADVSEVPPQLNISSAARHTKRDRVSVKKIFLRIVGLNAPVLALRAFDPFSYYGGAPLREFLSPA